MHSKCATVNCNCQCCSAHGSLCHDNEGPHGSSSRPHTKVLVRNCNWRLAVPPVPTCMQRPGTFQISSKKIPENSHPSAASDTLRTSAVQLPQILHLHSFWLSNWCVPQALCQAASVGSGRFEGLLAGCTILLAVDQARDGGTMSVREPGQHLKLQQTRLFRTACMFLLARRWCKQGRQLHHTLYVFCKHNVAVASRPKKHLVPYHLTPDPADVHGLRERQQPDQANRPDPARRPALAPLLAHRCRCTFWAAKAANAECKPSSMPAWGWGKR